MDNSDGRRVRIGQSISKERRLKVRSFEERTWQNYVKLLDTILIGEKCGRSSRKAPDRCDQDTWTTSCNTKYKKEMKETRHGWQLNFAAWRAIKIKQGRVLAHEETWKYLKAWSTSRLMSTIVGSKEKQERNVVVIKSRHFYIYINAII